MQDNGNGFLVHDPTCPIPDILESKWNGNFPGIRLEIVYNVLRQFFVPVYELSENVFRLAWWLWENKINTCKVNLVPQILSFYWTVTQE